MSIDVDSDVESQFNQAYSVAYVAEALLEHGGAFDATDITTFVRRSPNGGGYEFETQSEKTDGNGVPLVSFSFIPSNPEKSKNHWQEAFVNPDAIPDEMLEAAQDVLEADSRWGYVDYSF